MLAPVVTVLIALQLTLATDFSSFQWQPIYQRPEGQLFQPQLGMSVRQTFHDLVNYRDGPVRPYESPIHTPGYSPEDPEGLRRPGFEDRDFRSPPEDGYHYTPPTGLHSQSFEDRIYRPPHQNTYHRPPSAPHRNHFNHYGPPPYPPMHSFHQGFPHRNYHDKDQRPQNNYLSYNDFQGPPNRDGFDGPQTNRQPVLPGGSRTTNPLEVIFSWKQVDFEFPDENTREEMIRSQRFIPRNNLILDMDIYGQGSARRVWVTLPRVRPGVPVTLATVSSRRRAGTNLLRPFPDWRSHVQGDCQNSITSVFRTHIDQCGKLWVLDSGNNNAFVSGESRIVCPPQILIYDLNNYDQLIGRYRFPDSMIANTSLLVTINVDSRAGDCSDAVAYMADSMAFKLLAFRQRTGQFWSMNSDLFRPYPDQTRFSVNGVDFQLSGGIFGLALGPLVRGSRQLYFHCIDSVKQSVVATADIEDPQPWLTNVDAKPFVFRELNGSRSSQSAAAAMSDQGVMFFGLIGSNEMACWNSRTSFGQQNIVILAKDDTNLQFNSGIKVFDGRLYVVTSRLQNYVTNQVREQEDNYRILAADLRTLTRGTQCDVDTFPSDRFYDYPRPNNYPMFRY